MLNGTMVDVAVGLFLVFAMLSSACSVLNEYIQRLFDTRARQLERALETLLHDRDGTLFAKLKSHAMVRVIAHSRSKMPSYLPSSTFSTALFDSLVSVDGEHPLTFKRVRDAILQLPDGSDVKDALVSLSNTAENDIAMMRVRVERWFDDAMDRLSGAYKRRITTWILVLGMVVAAGTNADTIQLVQRLERDGAVRAAATAQAGAMVQKRVADRGSAAGPGITNGSASALRELVPDTSEVSADLDQLQQLDVMFWDTAQLSDPRTEASHPRAMRRPEWTASWLRWLLFKLVGFAMTALAISLGAPFWFDLLGRIVNMRATGAKPARAAPGGAEPARRSP